MLFRAITMAERSRPPCGLVQRSTSRRTRPNDAGPAGAVTSGFVSPASASIIGLLRRGLESADAGRDGERAHVLGVVGGDPRRRLQRFGADGPVVVHERLDRSAAVALGLRVVAAAMSWPGIQAGDGLR